MTGNLSAKTMKALAILAAAIVALAVALILIANANSPTRANALADFLGEVEVLTSESGREGLDGYYFARLKCDPLKVRARLSSHSHKTYASKTQTLENYYSNPAFKWPADLGVFNRDWIAYTISPGFFRVVAFPSDGRNEVLFLEFDT